MQRLNPTGSLLRARPFVARHDYIFALLCLLNVNMGALNTSPAPGNPDDTGGELSIEAVMAEGLLVDMTSVYQEVLLTFVAVPAAVAAAVCTRARVCARTCMCTCVYVRVWLY